MYVDDATLSWQDQDWLIWKQQNRTPKTAGYEYVILPALEYETQRLKIFPHVTKAAYDYLASPKSAILTTLLVNNSMLRKDCWKEDALIKRVNKDEIRSSAQGNCSVKSLVASVMSSILSYLPILPCPPYLPPVILSEGGIYLEGGPPPVGDPTEGRGVPQGGGGSHRGEGVGDILVQLPYTALPHGASP